MNKFKSSICRIIIIASIVILGGAIIDTIYYQDWASLFWTGGTIAGTLVFWFFYDWLYRE